jgi:hypothetical protein
VPRLIWLRICRSVTSGFTSGWLREGLSFMHMAMLAIAVVATALAPWFFSRRDVAT